MANPITGPVLAFASRLRFPTLFFLMLGLWLLNTVVLDPIPFVDEILMGLATLALASWKKGRQAKPGGDGDGPGDGRGEGRVIEGESRRQ